MGGFANGRAASTTLHLKETELHYLVGKGLKTAFGLGQNTLFFEIPVAGSRADILYVQTSQHDGTTLEPGIHVFEVKMRWDSDRQRLEKQLTDYASSADYVWAVGVNKVLNISHERVGVLAFSTLSCGIRVMKQAAPSERVELARRQDVLSGIAERLRQKYLMVADMAKVNPPGERKLMLQTTLGLDGMVCG